ncbi:hypothetical protein VP142E351_P0036 [Vibrio phage 142E35-1]|nr:hypothetical protein VP142E351_P0036 [Vibrio phage 142E35-1]
MSNKWVNFTERYPDESGLYETRYSEDERVSVMYFRTNKLGYSDSQWVSQNGETGGVYKGCSWQGRLPDEWRSIATERIQQS